MGYVEGVVSKLLIVLRVDMTHQSSSFFQNVHQSTSVVVSKKGRPCPWLPSHPVLRHWVCARFRCHSRKKLRMFHWRKKIKNKHATASWSNFDSSTRGSRPSTKWTTTKRVKLSRELPLHPEMSSTVYPRACVREWGTEYVRPCVQFFSSCTYSFFCGWFVHVLGLRWWPLVSLTYLYISTCTSASMSTLHLHLL